MPLCRKCRVREASEIWHDGLCPHCYFEYNEKRKKEEQRDREQREERKRYEERDREERRRRDAQEREERQHRERLEELREEEVEYQRQAARDAEEARRIAGLTTFTCCHCQGTFNEERGYSAIESPIGKPVCNKCYDLLKKCTECNQYFWKNDPRSTPIRPLEKKYYKSGSIIKVKDRNDYICDNCVSTAKYESFFEEQKKLKQEYDTQERIRKEKEATERAERERKEAAKRADAAEQYLINEERIVKEKMERDEESYNKDRLINIFIGIFITPLSIVVYYFLLLDNFTGLILGLIFGISVIISATFKYHLDFGTNLVIAFFCGGILGSACLALLARVFFTETFVTPFSILSVILTVVPLLGIAWIRNSEFSCPDLSRLNSLAKIKKELQNAIQSNNQEMIDQSLKKIRETYGVGPKF